MGRSLWSTTRASASRCPESIGASTSPSAACASARGIQLKRGGATHTAKGWCVGSVSGWATTAEGRARVEAEFATLKKPDRREALLRRYGLAANTTFVDAGKEPALRALYRGEAAGGTLQ